MDPEHEKLRMIAFNLERDRSFERDDEFFEHNPIREEAPRMIVQNDAKCCKDQRSALMSLTETSMKSYQHIDTSPLCSPTSTVDSYVTAPIYFNPAADSFSSYQHQSQNVRMVMHDNHPGLRMMQLTSHPLEHAALAMNLSNPEMTYWHHFPDQGGFIPFQKLTPFQAIMKEVFRGQVARDMARMADMAREQAEYWLRFVPWQ